MTNSKIITTALNDDELSIISIFRNSEKTLTYIIKNNCTSCKHATESFIVDDSDGEVYCCECHDELLYDREHQ